MNIQEALKLLGAVGTDNAPTADELTAARAVVVEAAKLAKSEGDRAALATMLETIKLADQAIEEAEELQAKETEELNALVKDFPELADESGANEELEAKTEAPAEDAPRMLSVAEAAQRLGLTQVASDAPIEVNDRPTQTLTINGEEANDASWNRLGQEFGKVTKLGQRSGRTTIATFRTEYEHNLSGKAGENSRVLDDLSRQAGDPAIVAAGGCCSLAEPIRDQPMLASLARPIADSLPTVGATAGAVSLFPSICLPVEGVATWTCDQDAAVDPEDPDTWKDCTHIDCEESDTVTVEAIYRCLTIGNFQHRFAPERWEAILHATAAQQARLSEVTLFNQIATSGNTLTRTVTDTGSIYATLLQTFLSAAAAIRSSQRYDNVRIKAIAPLWLRDAANADRIARAAARGRAVDVSPVEDVLADANIDVTWSPDLNPITMGGATGALESFPEEASVVLYADGGVFRLDGGELNLGTEIRDHDLNRQNSVAAFSETFEHALVRSCDTMALTLPVTVCGAAPCEPAAAAGE